MTLAAAWAMVRPLGWASSATQPGQTAFTRMPSLATSAASSRGSAFRAALETPEGGEPPVITAIEPPSLLTFTILGRELARSIGSSTWMTRHAPKRLMSSASATAPRSALLAVAQRSNGVEALFTSTSVRPNRPFPQSAIASTLSVLSTSSWQATIRSPSGSSSLAASSPFRRSREHSTTPYPSRASWRQISRPTPRLPPVTTATGRSTYTRTAVAVPHPDVSHGCHLAIRRQLAPTDNRLNRSSAGHFMTSLGRRGGGGNRGSRGSAGTVLELLEAVAEPAQDDVGRAPPEPPGEE